jgi:hypothetical protein
MRVDQVYVSNSIRFFKDGLLKRYKLKEYYDINKPALFFGLSESSNLIKEHQGIKILLPCTPNDYPNISNYENTFFICSENYNLPNNVVRKSITPEIKDYSMFTPNVLGDKVYYYSGFKHGWNWKNNIIDEIQKNINFEIITTSHENLKDYYDIKHLKDNFYDKCFLNLNFSGGNGLATVKELGLMGRKTVFKSGYKNNIQRLEFPNFINYSSIEDVIGIIENESKKIGTIQPSIDAHNVGDEWLNLNYWL